jgi:hypothetical protein
MKIKPCRATPLLYQLSNAGIVAFALIFRERLPENYAPFTAMFYWSFGAIVPYMLKPFSNSQS